ncbi:hypothetical protein ACFX12_010529 [Malus domestica]
MSRDLYLSSVVPIGALYSLSLWLSNSAYIFLSVSFIQMLKALMPSPSTPSASPSSNVAIISLISRYYR